MAAMMVLMLVLVLAGPGHHMGSHGAEQAPAQGAPSQEHEPAKPDPGNKA